MAFEAFIKREYSLEPQQIPRAEYAMQRQGYLDTATGEARTALGDLLQYPEPQKLVLPDINAIRGAHVGKTRQNLSTLNQVVHTYCIPDLSAAHLQSCPIDSQVASIMRHHVDADLIQSIKECWTAMRDWMDQTGVQIATVHPDGGQDMLFDLAGPMDFDPSKDKRKPLQWVPPEQSAVQNHWQASVLVRRIAGVFFKSFVQEWKREAAAGEAYKRLQGWAPVSFMLKGIGSEFATPEAIIRSGASTMVEQTANATDKLCEFMGRAHSVDILDADDPHYQTSLREHPGYLAELASFGIQPFSHFEQTVLAGPQKLGTMPKDHRAFLEQYGLLQHADHHDKDWGDVASRDCPLIDTYFQLWTDASKSILDINLDQFTPEQVTQMLSTALYTKCHARGQVMKEMIQWFLDIYTKWVLPMFKYESGKR